MDPKEGVIKRPGSLSNAENASTVEGFQVEYVDPNVTHFKKEMGWFSILAAGFDSLATWVTFPSTLLVSFVYGGPYCTIWGLIATGVIFLPIAITICELVAVYPTVGGQYHWSAILAPRKYHREISYACGYLSWFSWIALTAAGAGGLGNYVVALIKWKNPEYAVQKYQVFLIYQFGNIWNFIINAYCSSALPKVYKAGFVFSITSCVTIFIAVLAAQKKKNTSSFVWTDVNNITGWADGLQFIIALSGPTVMFCAIDGAVHLVEDTKRPAKVIPRTILVSLILSFTIAIGFSLAMLYCISDFEAALASPTGFPIFEIWRQAMGSDAWAVTFIVFLLIMVPVSVLPLVQIVSRMTWSLANDKGLLFSSYLSQVSERHKTPIPALAFNTTLVFLIGCLYLISNTAFIALLTISVVFQQITLAFPSALLIYRRRSPKYLPANRPFKVPNSVGWACNIISVAYAAIAVVFFQFPMTKEVTLSNMNYTSLVFVASMLAGVATWFMTARKHYTPPTVMLNQDSD